MEIAKFVLYSVGFFVSVFTFSFSILELAYFIRCVREKCQPLVGIRDGKRALEVAIEVLRQIHEPSVRQGQENNLNMSAVS